MINVRGKQITAIAIGSRAIAAVYRGARLVWSRLRSVCCFDSGVWKQDKTWNNNKTWIG